MTIKILIIDDHPSQIEGYKVILGYNESGYEPVITTAFNCESAYQIITDAKNKGVFDIAFLDWNLPPYPEQNVRNGEDLAILIRKHMPTTKIIMLTSHSEGFLLYNIVQKINPWGLMVKSDFTAEELLKAFDTVMQNKIYYTVTVRENVKKLISKSDYLDNYNRQIITLLAQGIKTKNLPEYLPLSQSAVEKRKVNIKDYFGIDSGGDEEILREAKRQGYI